MKFLRQWMAMAAVVAVACGALAQTRAAPAGGGGDASIGGVKMPQLSGNATRARTPSFAGGGVKEWGVFDVEFDSAQEWTDVNVNFMLFMENPKDAEKPFSFFKVSARYPDVERGRRKKVGAVLSPEGLKRFGNVIGFGVEFVVGGKVVASGQVESGVLKGKEKWWDDQQIVGSPKTVRRDGYFMKRGDTPFAYVNTDEYEMSGK